MTFLNYVDVPSDDIDAIFEWHSAKHIKMFDHSRMNDIAVTIWQRVQQFQTKSLKSLSLTLQPTSWKQIEIEQFFEHVESLQEVFLHGTIELEIDQLMYFVEKLKENKGLTVERGSNHVVSIKRKSTFKRILGALPGLSRFFG